MLAAEQGNLEIVKELLKKGANCNLEDTVSISVIFFFQDGSLTSTNVSGPKLSCSSASGLLSEAPLRLSSDQL